MRIARAVLAMLLLLPVYAQEPGEFRLVSDVQLVLLDVAVRRPAGTYVRGLTRENFRIFDNGKATPLTAFHEADLPVTLGLVIDASGSMKPKREEAIQAALLLLAESNPNDEVFVVAFNDNVRFTLPPGTPFSSDRNLLRSALFGEPAQGRTALHDGIRQALDHLNKGTRPRKALVVISDGGDNASTTSEQEVLRLAQQSHATVFTIGIYQPEHPEANPGLLRRLAEWSGGEVFLPASRFNQPLDEVCRRIARDLRARYLLGFAPSASLTTQRRKIRVTATSADEPKLTVRARRFYFAGPPQTGGTSQ
jgi:VWFA-related protein